MHVVYATIKIVRLSVMGMALAKSPIVNLLLLSTLSLSTVLLTFYMDSTFSSLTILWTTIVLVMWGAAELWLIGAKANVVGYDTYDGWVWSLLGKQTWIGNCK